MKDQRHENIKLVKSFYAAVSRGELAAARNQLDTDVEWIEPGLAGLWFSGTHRGAEAVLREVIVPASEKIETFRVKIRKFFGVGDHVVAVGGFRGVVKATGKDLDAATAHVWTLRNGKAVRFEGFHDVSEWREALGLAQVEPQRMAA